jgi:hypothetical protein
LLREGNWLVDGHITPYPSLTSRKTVAGKADQTEDGHLGDEHALAATMANGIADVRERQGLKAPLRR